MVSPILRYISPGEQDTMFSRTLYATPETTALADDSQEVQLAKARKTLEFREAVKDLIEDPRYQIVQEQLYNYVRTALDNQVWGHILSGEHDRVLAMAIERQGIVSFFESMDRISILVDDARNKLETLQKLAPGEQVDAAPTIEEMNA